MMNGLLRKATLLSACGLLAASAAMAGVPSASTSLIGKSIKYVWLTSGAANAAGVYAITVNDAGGNPVANSTVTIDASASTDVHVMSVQPAAGVGVSCGANTVIAVTNGAGVATFNVVGWANNVGGGLPGAPAAGSSHGAGLVKADGVTLGSIDIACPNQVLSGAISAAVGGLDASRVLNDALNQTYVAGPPPQASTAAAYRGRSDINLLGDNVAGTINGLDFSAVLKIAFASSLLDTDGGTTATDCP